MSRATQRVTSFLALYFTVQAVTLAVVVGVFGGLVSSLRQWDTTSQALFGVWDTFSIVGTIIILGVAAYVLWRGNLHWSPTANSRVRSFSMKLIAAVMWTVALYKVGSIWVVFMSVWNAFDVNELVFYYSIHNSSSARILLGCAMAYMLMVAGALMWRDGQLPQILLSPCKLLSFLSLLIFVINMSNLSVFLILSYPLDLPVDSLWAILPSVPAVFSLLLVAIFWNHDPMEGIRYRKNVKPIVWRLCSVIVFCYLIYRFVGTVMGIRSFAVLSKSSGYYELLDIIIIVTADVGVLVVTSVVLMLGGVSLWRARKI